MQVLSSSWDGRPFGHNTHEPKIGGYYAPFWAENRWSQAETTAGTSTDVEWPEIASLIITLESKRWV